MLMPQQVLDDVTALIRSLKVEGFPDLSKVEGKLLPQPNTTKREIYEFRADHVMFRLYHIIEKPPVWKMQKLWNQKKKFMDSFFADVPKGSGKCALMANAVMTPLYEKFGLTPSTITVERNKKVMVLRTSFVETNTGHWTVSFSGTVNY